MPFSKLSRLNFNPGNGAGIRKTKQMGAGRRRALVAPCPHKHVPAHTHQHTTLAHTNLACHVQRYGANRLVPYAHVCVHTHTRTSRSDKKFEGADGWIVTETATPPPNSPDRFSRDQIRTRTTARTSMSIDSLGIVCSVSEAAVDRNLDGGLGSALQEVLDPSECISHRGDNTHGGPVQS